MPLDQQYCGGIISSCISILSRIVPLHGMQMLSISLEPYCVCIIWNGRRDAVAIAISITIAV